jgi:uncharacterized Zn-binding protein involved in type VI secretion
MSSPGITRKGIDAAGGILISGSGDVFANNAEVVRIGDVVAPHGLPPHVVPPMVTGSSNVFTNNIPTCREGDVASCGHQATGSSNVFVGD